MIMMQTRLVLGMAVFGVLIFAQDARAMYLDPGTGSMLIQITIASILSGLAILKMYWSKVSGIFRKKR
jgi:hypothetical protein